MANARKGVVAFLLAFTILSVAMLFDGIDRMKRNGVPPFAEGMVTSVDFLSRPPEKIIENLDKRGWRIAVCAISAAALIACGYFAFQSGRLELPFAILLLWATASGIFGLWVWLYSMFHKFKS